MSAAKWKRHTSAELFGYLTAKGNQPATIYGCDARKYTGLVQSVAREDGSGECFIVAVDTAKGRESVFVRTIA